jgi:hypothetical protein
MLARRKSGAKTTMRQGATAKDHPLADRAPAAKSLTPYDEAHLVTYLRLLDANASGEPTDAMTQIVLDANPALTESQARRAVTSHLKRAQWISAEGYRDFLKKPDSQRKNRR